MYVYAGRCVYMLVGVYMLREVCVSAGRSVYMLVKVYVYAGRGVCLCL